MLGMAGSILWDEQRLEHQRKAEERPSIGKKVKPFSLWGMRVPLGWNLLMGARLSGL